MSERKKNLMLALMGFLILVLVGVIVFLAISSKKINMIMEEEISPAQETAQEKENELDYCFLKMENEEVNKIYSPLSIKYALKMLEEGANGNTKAQIQELTKNIELTKYNNIDDVLSMANCAYIRSSYKEYVLGDYKKTITSKYGAEINFDDFKNATNINAWIERKTMGIIKNMLSDDMVSNPNAELFLINALAIDMEWIDMFGSGTSGKEFTLADGSKTEVSMMKRETKKENTSFYKDSKITALTMDLKKYGDTQLEFTAIMPNGSLKEYASNFSKTELDKIDKNSKKASNVRDGVIINIPRFSFEYDLELKEDLQKLGIKDAFMLSADFSSMTNNADGLYVSEALHKANIDFTEKGVKAAAATAFGLVAAGISSYVPHPEVITIDNPFLFVIRDKGTGELWFVGTVYEPELWKDAQKEDSPLNHILDNWKDNYIEDNNV